MILAGLFVIGGISNAINPPKDTGGNVAVQAPDPSSSSTSSSSTSSSEGATTSTAAPSTTSTASAKPKSPPPATTHSAPAPTTHRATTKPPTVSQEQALGAAQDYLNVTAFSRAGLIDQLSSSAGSGFSKADATWAVDHLSVNWNEQAVKAAKDYLQLTHFSCNGLIEQLSSSAGVAVHGGAGDLRGEQAGVMTLTRTVRAARDEAERPAAGSGCKRLRDDGCGVEMILGHLFAQAPGDCDRLTT